MLNPVILKVAELYQALSGVLQVLLADFKLGVEQPDFSEGKL